MEKTQIRGRGGSRFRPSKVELADYFPLEVGFSIALHKAQVRVPVTPRPTYASEITYFKKHFSYVTHIQTTKGRNIRKVILSISEHPNHFIRMKWEGLYVALSQVRFRNDVRLLLKCGDRSTMDYIIHLNKNAFINISSIDIVHVYILFNVLAATLINFYH